MTIREELASLLPFKAQYQELANSLPEGDVLIILPSSDNRQRARFEKVVTMLRVKGHQVTTLPAERFG